MYTEYICATHYCKVNYYKYVYVNTHVSSICVKQQNTASSPEPSGCLS